VARPLILGLACTAALLVACESRTPTLPGSDAADEQGAPGLTLFDSPPLSLVDTSSLAYEEREELYWIAELMIRDDIEPCASYREHAMDEVWGNLWKKDSGLVWSPTTGGTTGQHGGPPNGADIWFSESLINEQMSNGGYFDEIAKTIVHEVAHHFGIDHSDSPRNNYQLEDYCYWL